MDVLHPTANRPFELQTQEVSLPSHSSRLFTGSLYNMFQEGYTTELGLYISVFAYWGVSKEGAQ
jgi:hypothetical protein